MRFRPRPEARARSGFLVHLAQIFDRKGHEGWIALESAQLGGRPSSGNRDKSREGPGPSLSEVVVPKLGDTSWPPLFREAFEGESMTVLIVS